MCPVVPGKKIFLKCFTIYGHGSTLGRDLQNVDEFSLTCTYKLTFKIKLKNGPVVSEKRKFNHHL